MGDRVGYRIREDDKVSHLIRKQWKIDNIKMLVSDVAGRLTAALYHVVYNPPFDSIQTDPLSCDISDNGLYEIELVNWNYWKVHNYSIGWEGDDVHLFDECLIAEVRFTNGKSLTDGMNYTEAM